MTRTILALAIYAILLLAGPPSSNAQEGTRTRVLPRITTAADDNQVVTLKGQVHRFAKPEFDEGLVPPEARMERMVLLLRGSDEQETALDRLLTDLHDEQSPEYHHWLTPEQFGKRFGAADGDIRSIQQWLSSHGFSLGAVANNHRMLEFSGTASMM